LACSWGLEKIFRNMAGDEYGGVADHWGHPLVAKEVSQKDLGRVEGKNDAAGFSRQ